MESDGSDVDVVYEYVPLHGGESEQGSSQRGLSGPGAAYHAHLVNQ